MFHCDGSWKMYCVYQNNKLYWKRCLNGPFSNDRAKYFYVSAETALFVLLINLTPLIPFCNIQASLNVIPSPKISLVVNFMLNYVESWCTDYQDLSLFLSRFHLYADAIVGKDNCISADNMHCHIVPFTDSKFIPTFCPHENGNHCHKIHDFTQFSRKHQLHDHKFLGLSYPNGLISMYGPFGGTRHDGIMLLAALIWIILARFVLRTKGGGQYSGIQLSLSAGIVLGRVSKDLL